MTWRFMTVNNNEMAIKCENAQKIVDVRKFICTKYRDTNMIGWGRYCMHNVNVFRILKTYRYGINQQLCGLLHNLLKNTNTTLEEIIIQSNSDVGEAIKVLSLANIEFITEEYMNKVKENNIALPVSLADRLEKLNSIVTNNLDLVRKKKIIIEDTKTYFDSLFKDSPFREDYCKKMDIINKRRY
jgi:(p)ppGpp synthase/HD superfamily hydrolase